MYLNDSDLRIRFWSKVKIVDKPFEPDACWEWQFGLSDKGYGKFVTYKLIQSGIKIIKKFTMERAHRIAFKLWNMVDNIDNMKDMVNKARQGFGETRGFISNSDMVKIKDLILQGKSHKEIAKQFDCSKRYINNIANGSRRKVV